LIPRINSTLPLYTLYRNTCRLTRKHSRLSLIAAAALAAGAFGAVATDMAPQAEAAANVTPSAHVTVTTQLDSLMIPVTGGASTAATGDVPRASDWATGLSLSQAPAAVASTAPAAGAKGQAAPARPAKPQATPAHAAPSHAAQAHPAASRPAAAHPAPAPPMKPFVIYDSVMPASIPAGQRVATYANGAYAQSAASLSGRGHVLWIDTNGSDPKADVLDVEPGDATPSGAAQWVKAKLSSQPNSVAIVYTMRSDWQAVKGDVGALPARMQAQVRYWIADPTGVAHVVPGSNATQWYWGQNYDITTANAGFES
jgi:hypothetical protein